MSTRVYFRRLHGGVLLLRGDRAEHPAVSRNTRLRVSACGATLQLRCFQLSSQEEAELLRRRAEPSVMLKVISVLMQKFNYVAAEEERGVNELADGSHSLSTQSSAEEHPL